MRRIVLVTVPLLVFALGVSCGREAAARQSAKPAAAADLDRLLAPIALYPDQLLAQMLLCAQDPPMVTRLNDWLAGNMAMKGTELQDAATLEGFGPSFVGLALFPQVVKEMAGQPDWTSRLGKAFTADRASVFDSIQRLRAQARTAGTLMSTPQQDVETRTTSTGEQFIVIEPANPQVVYVPQYDSQVVYTQPATTVVVKQDDDADAAVAGLIGFTAGIAIGAAIDNDYYYGPYGWHGGAYMYNDAWDDWYDAREDAREDWTEHREELAEERGERSRDAQEQRTERAEGGQQARTESQAQRTERQDGRQENRASGASTTSTYESRGHARGSDRATEPRRGTSSDAFSGYSSGRGERAASTRGQRSRSGSRAGGGRRR